MRKVLVAIPCYNCEKQISRTLHELVSKKTEQIDRILILDNQSKDETLKMAQEFVEKLPTEKKELKEKFLILKNEKNLGLGGSQKKAFFYGIKNNFHWIFILHGDNQADSQELYDLLQEANKYNYSCVLGSRFMRESRLVNYSLIRIIGNIFFNILYSLGAGKIIKDLGSGLNLFSKASIEQSNFLHHSNAMTFNMDLVLDLHSNKRNSIKFYPITWKEADQVSNARNLQVGIETTKALWRFLRGRKNNQYLDPEKFSYNS